MLTTKKKFFCMCFALVLLFTAIGISLNLQKVAMAATEQTYFPQKNIQIVITYCYQMVIYRIKL